MLKLDAASRALSIAQTRLGQLRRRVSYRDLVDYVLGDVAEAHALIAEEWQASTEDRERIVKEVMGDGQE